MTRPGKVFWIIFGFVQLIGVIGAEFWSLVMTEPLGPLMWFCGFFLLMPGNLVGEFVAANVSWIRHLYWRERGLSVLLIQLAINFLTWALIAGLVLAGSNSTGKSTHYNKIS